jgi:hypothetical protein
MDFIALLCFALVDYIMVTRALWSLRVAYHITPLSRRHYGSANLTSSKQISSNSVMGPKFSEGADKSQLMRESNALLEGGWTLDEEQIGVKKTYFFETYSKCLVGHSLDFL